MFAISDPISCIFTANLSFFNIDAFPSFSQKVMWGGGCVRVYVLNSERRGPCRLGQIDGPETGA